MRKTVFSVDYLDSDSSLFQVWLRAPTFFGIGNLLLKPSKILLKTAFSKNSFTSLPLHFHISTLLLKTFSIKIQQIAKKSHR